MAVRLFKQKRMWSYAKSSDSVLELFGEDSSIDDFAGELEITSARILQLPEEAWTDFGEIEGAIRAFGPNFVA
jgi:hypothetical protein